MNRLTPGTFSTFPCKMAYGIPGNEQLVLAWIWKFSNNDSGKCWPSHRLLAKASRLSVATVKRAIDGLEKRGYVVSQHRYNDSGRTSNLYTAMIVDVEEGRIQGQLPIAQTELGGLAHTELGVQLTGSYELDPVITKEEVPVIGKESYEEDDKKDRLKVLVLWACSLWKDRMGIVSFPRMNKALRGLLDSFSDLEIIEAFKYYMRTGDPQYMSPEVFVSRITMMVKASGCVATVKKEEEWVPE